DTELIHVTVPHHVHAAHGALLSSAHDTFAGRCCARRGGSVLRPESQRSVRIVRAPFDETFGPADAIDGVVIDFEIVWRVLEPGRAAQASDVALRVLDARVDADEPIPVALGFALDRVPNQIDLRARRDLIDLGHGRLLLAENI